MDEQNDPLACLRRGFEIKDKGAGWELHCKTCKRGWALKKSVTKVHPGNLLHLLNHEASHTHKARAKTNTSSQGREFGDHGD